jgi:hypothetical protein
MKLFKNGKLLKEEFTREEFKEMLKEEKQTGKHEIFIEDKKITIKKRRKAKK